MKENDGRSQSKVSNVGKEKPGMTFCTNITRRLRSGLMTLVVALLATAIMTPTASADFGLNEFDVEFTNQDGTTATQAGSHPFAMTSRFGVNNTEVGPFVFDPDGGKAKDIFFEQIAGFVGDATAVPRCSTVDFLYPPEKSNRPNCADDTVVGGTAAALIVPFFWTNSPVYNLEPPPGVVVRLGFQFESVKVTVDAVAKDGGDYNVTANLVNLPETLTVLGGVFQLWGDPSDPAHDAFRGRCWVPSETHLEGFTASEIKFLPAATSCPVAALDRPFLTLPRSCSGPSLSVWRAAPWLNPNAWASGSAITHDDAVPPNPQGLTGCGKLGFAPRIESQVSTDSAETGTGLSFNLDVDDEGLTSVDGLAQSESKKAEVTLPEGVTINPSVGEGLGVCTPADLDRETLQSKPGEGCPNSSKVGTLDVELPILDEAIDGSIYLAQQDDPNTSVPGAENPFDSLIALYFVVRNPNLAVLAKLPVLVEPDPQTGQLVVTLDDIPQFPLSHFSANLREGQRAPLVSPATCGTYTTEAKLYPWSDPGNPRTVLSSFEITEGIGAGPCPPGGLPPFKPHFEAGSINNNAGSFSPFNMRLIRSDGEQDMTKFSSVLPPGVLGSLAGVSKCPDSAIDVAKSKTGREELASPSCPANSLIGHTLAGAGVGGALTYVKGQVYLGGPYKGRPLSVISVTPAVAGPFDAGTVVVRLALNLNPKTAEVEVDGAASDPIPHILKGIVLKVRDLRVYVDRPNFTLNPTSCDESSARATLFGSYLNVFDSGDDVPVDLSTRYQAANCLNLGFKPKLALNLKGGTKRGGHPGLAAIYTPRKGDANVEGLVVRLPRSAFLDQGHIRTICTRVQFAADTCPKAAQYGFIRAWTPLLEEPLAGPVWLRSSNHKLPDLVFDLHGLVDVEVSTRIDSAKGGIRATVESAPDAPLSKVVLSMQGGKKGLIVNSRDLCGAKSRANVQFSGHNGKQHNANPVMRPQCGGKSKSKRAR